MSTNDDLEKRFWHKVRKLDGDNSCFVWIGAINLKGYGVFNAGMGKTSTAHRFSYKLANPGVVIKDGLCILHSCDNRRCVNPKHLRLGTNKDNSRDMVKRGRATKPGGRAHGNAKLTWSVVRNIRLNYTGKYGELRSLCVLYGVRKAAIQDLLAGRTWKEQE